MDTTFLETTHTPRVSIGMPVYNGEQFIHEALDALLAQTFTDFELIISDNASTDRTEEICRKYAAKDRRIRYVRQETNLGIAANFQYVLDEAVGEYFMWAAHDDWWDPNFIQELASLLDYDIMAVIAFCRMQHVYVGGEVFRTYPNITLVSPKKNKQGIIVTSSFRRFLLQNLIHGKVNIIYGLMRRKILIKSDSIRKWGDWGWGADLLMVAQILRYGNVVFSNKFLFKKCENPESEGSLKKINQGSKKNLIKILKGVINTWTAYNKYCFGVWLVQGIYSGANSISLICRVYITLYEFIRTNYWFLVQVFNALSRRLMKQFKNSYCEVL